MKLKKIRMVGFKSFAAETIVEPEDGLTAVVGPNGCGKTNILDAVRWVLGEKSAKNLRGKSMDDVIFQGSESRKPAGMAEVELFFDNTSRMLTLDRDEVVIGRRIYLNSGSEYLINGKKSTRREMERVFMDTGIGKAAYSIMEQGAMGQILKASPEDRRQLFDEAAGISRFKAEKQETLARLRDTEQNLLRLSDILKTKQDELKYLEKQASKTREYLALKEDLDRSDKNLRYLRYTELDGRRGKVDEKLNALLKKKDSIFERISAGDSKLEELEETLTSRLEEVHRLDREYHQDISSMEQIEKDIERLGRDRQERLEKLDNLEDLRKEEDRLHKEIVRERDSSRQLELDLDAQLGSLKDMTAKLEEQVQTHRKNIQNSHVEEDRYASELAELEEGEAAALEEFKELTGQFIQELDQKKQELKANESARVQLKQGFVTRLQKGRELISDALGKLEKGDAAAASAVLKQVKFSEIVAGFDELEGIENEFRSLLFDESGVLSRKEELDRRMDELRQRREFIRKEITRLNENRKLETAALEKEKNRKVEMDLQIRDFEVRRESSVEMRGNIETRLEEARKRLAFYNEEIDGLKADMVRLTTEEETRVTELAQIKERKAEQITAMETARGQADTLREEINGLKEGSRKDRDQIEKILPEISDQERRAENISIAISTLEEELYTDFQTSIGELVEAGAALELDKAREEDTFRTLKDRIRALGQFNPLAIEELRRGQEVYDQLQRQKQDVEDAKENILSILRDIEDKSRTLFADTFERIQNNFRETFQTLFNGGNATLRLTDESDPLNSGVEIMAQPPGKKNASITLLSGGEQSMTAIALMFATYLVRPSPFCFLDEIDAPLDENNTARFLRMLGGFAGRSQFLVITHSKLTMARSDAIFGVTQEEPGISKIVSVKLKDQPAPAAV